MAGIPQVITEDRASGAQFIDGSLKFDSGKSQYLKRSLTGDGNRKLWTWSGWLKRTPGALHDIFSAGQEVTNDGLYSRFRIDSDDYLNYRQWVNNSSLDAYLVSSMKLRDPSAYFHYVAIYDSNNSTNSDKVRFYINGQRVTVFSSNDYPGGTNRGWVNAGSKTHTIGGHYDGGTSADSFFNGYMSQVYFLDGIAAGPEEFGYTDPLTNTWRPKKYVQSGANNGTTWSSGTTSGSIEGVRPWALGFDGREDTFTRPDSGQVASIMFDTPINFTNKFEIRGARDSGNTGSIEVYDGTDAWIDVSSSFGSYSQAYDYPRVNITSSITSPVKGIRFNGVSAASQPRFTQIYVDDKILIDGDTSNMGLHGFYLPMDGNTPIGKDQSGRGNDWTPVNFGGSVDLPKATGAIPVLNTNDAGTIAKPGVRTDKKTYTVTASGGNYYLDGALKPTLNAYRGSSLIFDYTGAGSHPLYLSSLPDGKHNSKAYSVEFYGSDYLSIPSSSDFDFGSGDCTVECFVYITSHAGDKTIIGSWEGTTSWQLSYGADSGNDRFAFMMHDGSSTLAAISSFQSTNYVNQWVHLAGVRHGNWLKVYVNGIFGGERSISGAHTTFNAPLTIGGRSNGNQVTGYVSNVRVVKGTALYTAAFTPPSTTLTNVTGTTLLCCQESNVTTAEVSPGTITDGGFPSSSQSRQPFLYDNNHGNFGLNTLDIDTTKITIPHIAADTLYYYCNAHSGMGSSINVTTDIFKADPYAWKCMFAMASDTVDHSPEINVNSTASIFGDIHTTTPQPLRNFYGHSKKMESGGGFRIDMELTTPEADAKHKFETNDFTLECWHYNDGSQSAWHSLFRSASYNNPSGTGGTGIAHYGYSQSLWPYSLVSGSGQNWGQTENVVPYKKWHHTAWTRQGGVNRIFANGILVKTFNNSNSWDNRGWEIGDAHTWTGGYQDARIYNGVAKYTENFVVGSTTPDVLPDTPSGIIGKTNLTKITEGAVSFDGSGDYLTVAGPGTLAASSNWCMECFFYCTGDSSGTYRIMSANESAQSSEYILMRIRLGQYQFSTDVANSQPINTAIFNKWTHMAFTKEGTTVRGFVDGKKIWETTDNNTVTITNLITGWGYGGEYFPGFISNARFVNGSSVYTADFTPPTTSLTNITNTYLLCCQSNTSASAATVAPGTFVNDGTNYSSNNQVTGSTGLVNADSIFNGHLKVSGIPTLNEGATVSLSSDNYILWTPTTGIPYSSKVEVYCYAPNGYNITNYYTFNGGTETSFVGGAANYNGNNWITVATGSGTINSIKLRLTRSSGQSQVGWYAVKVDGTILINDYNGKSIGKYDNTSATNFNPFTDDINAIRGQASGYATLNPLNVTGTLSNNNLSFYRVAKGGTTSTIGVESGKIYVEAKGDVGSGGFGFGFVQSNYNNDGLTDIGDATNSFGIRAVNTGATFKVAGGSNTGITKSTTVNTIYAFAVDFDTGLVNLLIDGVIVHTQTLSLASGTYYAAVASETSSATKNVHVNFGQKPFKFLPPDGFQPLNLSNVQLEKVIARPDQYFGVSLWSGNGVSQNITGLKHKPDFVWIKKRAGGTARSHQLFDSVRGVYQTLHSNSAGVEDTNTNRLTAFNQDGFAVGGDDGCNGSSGTFVGWTWKAGGNNNLFNIDDEGYLNASDVNMNEGTLNSSFYNDSEVWSTTGTLTVDLNGSTVTNINSPLSNVFEGSLASSSMCTEGTAYTNGTKTYTYTFGTAQTNITSARVYLYQGNSAEGGAAGFGNGTVNKTQNGTYGWVDATSTIPSNGTVTAMTMTTTATSGVNSARNGFIAIELNGKILLDDGITPIDNFPSIAPTGCSVNTKSKFGIYTYTGSGSGEGTLSHGLEGTPGLIIYKKRNSSSSWQVYHQSLGGTVYNTLDEDVGDYTSDSTRFGGTNPTSSIITLGTHANGADDTIMYAWCDVPGLQKFGSWTGINSTNGTFVELGFRPSLVIAKESSATGSGAQWFMLDSSRNTYNPLNNILDANRENAERQGVIYDFLSNGFKIRTTFNSGATFIYMAWAEAPTVNLYGAQANAR